MNSLSVSVLKYFICVLCPPLYDSALFLGHYKTNTKKKKKDSMLIKERDIFE